MIKYRIRPEEGLVVLKVIEIGDDSCIIELRAQFLTYEQEEKLLDLEVGDEIALFDVTAITATVINR